MKRIGFIIVTIMIVTTLLVISCNKSSTGSAASGGSAETATVQPERAIPANAPQFVRDAVKKVPGDSLVGIGTAKGATLSLSRTLAQTRARADIARQLNTVVTTEGDVTIQSSEAVLTGTEVVEEDIDEDGNYWVVIAMNKDNY